jgi:hypothetical protein
MATVPYIFADQFGPIPLSQLDANFANIKALATNANTVTNPTQANITAVGTLTSLSVAGNITGGNLKTANGVYANTVFSRVDFSNTFVSGTGNITTGNLRVLQDTLIIGNLVVNGTTITQNANTITTNDLTITVGNNQSSASALNGAGLLVGLSNIARWQYDGIQNSWSSNVSITPTANNTLNLGSASTYWNTAFVNQANVLGTVTANQVNANNISTPGIVSASGNVVSGNIISAAGNVIGGNLSTSGSLLVLGTGNFLGSLTAPTAANGTVSNQVATTSFVTSAVFNATSALGTMSTQNANSVAIVGGAITGINTLDVNVGGTGQPTLTNNALLIGTGTSPVRFVSPGTNGNLLTASGGEWVSRTPATMATQNANAVAITGGSISGITALPVESGGTGRANLVTNALLIGNSTSAVKFVAPGTDGNLLTASGGEWVSRARLPFTIIYQGEITVNAVNSFLLDLFKSTLLFVYFGNGAGGNQFLFSNVEWGMESLNQQRIWYQAGVDFQVAQSGSLMAAFDPNTGATLYVRVNANNLGAYGAPGTARCLVLQF